jgi:hypothetical protein
MKLRSARKQSCGKRIAPIVGVFVLLDGFSLHAKCTCQNRRFAAPNHGACEKA